MCCSLPQERQAQRPKFSGGWFLGIGTIPEEASCLLHEETISSESPRQSAVTRAGTEWGCAQPVGIMCEAFLPRHLFFVEGQK